MFWAGVLVFGITLGLIIQFTRAWVDPSGLTPPGGDIAAPINAPINAASNQKRHALSRRTKSSREGGEKRRFIGFYDFSIIRRRQFHNGATNLRT